MIVDAIYIWKFFIAFSFFVYEILNSYIRLTIFFQIDCKVGGTCIELFYSLIENCYISSFLLGLSSCYWPLIWNNIDSLFSLFIYMFLVLLVSRENSSFAILELLFLNRIIFIRFLICLNLNDSGFTRLKHILISSLNNIVWILL